MFTSELTVEPPQALMHSLQASIAIAADFFCKAEAFEMKSDEDLQAVITSFRALVIEALP
jgi:hypothetical protein